MSAATGSAATGSAAGVVATYDDRRGYGTIAVDGGGSEGGELFFHCTSIADGSRTIEVGRRVRFAVAPGHLGRYEARAVEPLDA